MLGLVLRLLTLGIVRGPLLFPIYQLRVVPSATIGWYLYVLSSAWHIISPPRPPLTLNSHALPPSGMHAQLLCLSRLLQLLDPPLHAYLEREDCLNLFCCYRWLLIHFKREFTYEEVSKGLMQVVVMPQ